MQATRSKDGKYRADMRITFRVSISDLANALASAYRNHSLEDGQLPSLTIAAVQDAVRAEMTLYGQMTEGWADGRDMAETMERLTWAEDQIRRAYPELAKAEQARLAPMANRQTADPETVAEIHAARCRDCKGAGCPVCAYSGQDAKRVTPPAQTPAACIHGRTPRPDVVGDPATACASAIGGTEWGAFNAEGCTYAYCCAVDVANESAKENEEAESTPDDPESHWGEMCNEHRAEEQPKNGCEECDAEPDDEEDED